MQFFFIGEIIRFGDLYNEDSLDNRQETNANNGKSKNKYQNSNKINSDRGSDLYIKSIFSSSPSKLKLRLEKIPTTAICEKIDPCKKN